MNAISTSFQPPDSGDAANGYTPCRIALAALCCVGSIGILYKLAPKAMKHPAKAALPAAALIGITGFSLRYLAQAAMISQPSVEEKPPVSTVVAKEPPPLYLDPVKPAEVSPKRLGPFSAAAAAAGAPLERLAASGAASQRALFQFDLDDEEEGLDSCSSGSRGQDRRPSTDCRVDDDEEMGSRLEAIDRLAASYEEDR